MIHVLVDDAPAAVYTVASTDDSLYPFSRFPYNELPGSDIKVGVFDMDTLKKRLVSGESKLFYCSTNLTKHSTC